MANWCSTAVTLTGNADEVNELYQMMVRLENVSEPAINNGFGKTWLGCLVAELGKTWEEVSCRGEWSSLEMKGDVITFNTESAWSPCTEVFDLIKSVFPSIQIFYFAEEMGCLLLETNDFDGRYYPERYMVDLCTTEEDYMTEYFEERDAALAWIEELTGRKVESESDVETLNDELSAENVNAFCYLHEVEIV